MIKETPGATYCKRCDLPVSLGGTNARGESAAARHITVPDQPTECPEKK
ncbi:hypothetical protein [Streptomyces sp. NPDC054834]